MQLSLFDILNLMQVVTGAVTIVDNVESWPTPVVEKESNQIIQITLMYMY